MSIFEDQYIGCFLGLALGDALGAPYEDGIVEQLLWRVIGRTRRGELRFTDDTQMSLDLAQSLLAKQTLDQDDLAQCFAQSYHWSRGYGPSAARLLKQVRKGKAWQIANKQRYPQGSLGNGAAMRAPIIALFKPGSLPEMIQATRLSAEVTHAHPLGIAGAALIALATALLLQKPENPLSVLPQSQTPEFQERLQVAQTWLETREPVKAKQVAKALGNGITAPTSCVTALYCALRFLDDEFLMMLEFIKQVGGDVDTISAMAGALWGGYNGAVNLPNVQIEQRELIIQVARDLNEGFA